MIIFVGDEIKMGALVQVAKTRLKEDCVFVKEDFDITKQENDIILAAANEGSCILYDTDQYYNDGEEIVSTIKRIYRANNIKPVLLVPTNNPNNEILKHAVANQIKNFINTSKSIGEQKDEFEKIYADYYEGNKREDVVAVEAVVDEENKTLNAYVTELYDARQREIEQEKTVIIKKKGSLQVALDFIVGFVKTVAIIIIIAFVVIGAISLIYAAPRAELIKIFTQIYREVIQMIS